MPKISTLPPSSNQPFHKYELQFFNYADKKIKAYKINPYKKNLFYSIQNFFIELFTGKRTIIILVNDRHSNNELQSVYVKVDKLSRILQTDKKNLLKEIKEKSPQEISCFIETKMTVNKIKGLLNQLDDDEIREILEKLSKKNIGLEQINALIANGNVLPEKMAKTLVELGRKLKNRNYLPNSKTTYPFSIHENGISIWGESIQKKYFYIHAPTLDFKETSLQNAELIEFAIKSRLIKEFSHIENLVKKIGSKAANKIFMNTSDSEKLVILNTFIQIGKEIVNQQIGHKIFKKSIKNSNQKKSYAFSLSDHKIMIIKNKIGEGGQKIIHSALEIRFDSNNPSRFSENHIVRIKPNTKNSLLTLRELNNNLFRESKILMKYENCPYIVDPQQIWGYSSEKVVMTQKKYSCDGIELCGAPVHHQLSGLMHLGYGLQFIHEKGDVHMDVKLGNLFLEGNIKDEKPVRGKVGDLGLLAGAGKKAKGCTPDQLPPECFNRNGDLTPFQINAKIDCFSYGLTIINALLPQLFHLEIPYLPGCQSEQNFDKNFATFFRKFATHLKKQASSKENLKRMEMLKVAKQLVCFNPANRITCGEAAKKLESILNFKVEQP